MIEFLTDQTFLPVELISSSRFLTIVLYIQIELTQFPSLPPRVEETPKASEERVVARDIYESAVLFTSNRGDDAASDRNFALLMPYYLELRDMIPRSEREALVWGLWLLTLLVQNRIAEFHATVELVPSDVMQSPEVTQVMELEGWMMQGSYAKVGSAQNSAVSPYFVPVLQRIVTTVRNEIASCSEAAYKTLQLKDAESIFGVHSNDVPALCSEYGWTIEGDVIILQDQRVQQHRGLPEAEQVIDNCLQYAKELERIL